MAHAHSMYDTDQHFKIDPLTMVISTEADIKPLRKGEHLAEIKTFEMPRFLDGHDMTLCNKVEVHYNNVNVNTATRTTTEVKSFDTIKDFAVAPDDENTVIWSWHIAGDAATNSGNTSFCFRFACMDGDTITYQKWSEIYSSIPVHDTINNTEQFVTEYADALERWKLELNDLVSDETIAGAVSDYIEANGIEESDPTVPDWAKAAKKPSYTAEEVGALPNTTTIPTQLPNPKALTFTGAVTGSYDGSEAVSVEIPDGASKAVYSVTLTEPVSHIEVPLSIFEKCTKVFCEIFIPSISEESYDTYIPRIKVANSGSVWSQGRVFAGETITANKTAYVLVGEIVCLEDIIHKGFSFAYDRFSANRNTTGSWLGNTGPYSPAGAFDCVVFEIYSRIYQIPAESIITMVGY